MYRTDKQFMKNPATAPSRIYIGSIPKTIIADDLEAKFSKHGKILGLVINSGFAFIQYETEEEAKLAIRTENGSIMMGRKITVKQAFAGKESGAPQNKGLPSKIDNPPSRVPAQREGDMNIQENRTMSFEPPPPGDMEEEETEAPPNIRPPPIQKFGDGGGKRGGRGGGKMGRGGGGHNRPPVDRFEGPPPHGENFPERGLKPSGYFEDYGPPHGPPPQDVAPSTDRNDCEIIVVSRALTEYAEFIESRLKHIGLIVDLLFPNEDVPIGRVLANISSRGCLYAILVMPQNEEHRSLTLNILHGIPQEHRNMPIDDALLLLQRNFEAYMRGEVAPDNTVKMALADRHPVSIQMLFNLLAENRMLTSAQYDRIIKYLQERRELQKEHELSEGITQDSEESPKDKQSELQTRILQILNKGNDVPIPKSITSTEPAPKDGPTPLLKDPSVQRALDSILSGDMFKGLT